ncbi:MAG: ATP-binding protein [Saprospiraceae bacterium]|nr:ATP-binding protein [Saprospiraceae bacterium]
MKSPFKFLDAYSKEDKDVFFGRNVETEELYDRVFETNLILLYGALGTGKTSLINCGLANKFENTDWLPIFIRRNDNIVTSLYSSLSKHALTKVDKETSVQERIKSLYLDHFKPIYLIFDQFEELFLLGESKEQIAFFETLRGLMDEGLQCKILLSMREEYIAYLSEFELLIPSLFDNRQRIEKMGVLQIQEVIKGTSSAFGIEVKDFKAVIEKVIFKLKDPKAGIELSSLQVYLDRMYRKAVENRKPNLPITFSPELIEETGMFENVLELFLREQLMDIEAELKKQGSTVEDIPKTILFSLVTDEGGKKTVETDNLYEQLYKRKKITPKEIDYCIKRFQELRVLQEVK